MMGLQSVDWQQKPNARERTMFFAAMIVFFLGFLKACWFPSRSALSDLKEELHKLEQEKSVSIHLQATPQAGATIPQIPQSGSTAGIGSLKDVQSAIGTISQPLLLRGVKIQEVKTTDLEHEGNIVSQNVELQLVGSFYSMAEYLESLESLPAPLVIEDFSLALNDDRSGKVLADIKGRFYGMDK
ncbi:MAG: hypothetical protein COV45_00165 [Deltaproteobacteria bacterium CG11_big_fil_rev_8_21_14_0_20_47_16]|nr:MAG: hypothetical protein COV45_00165 [Deltaproteobacteria bacterium CG11_big_fil_rev_8_21_14_0_20_47_16]